MCFFMFFDYRQWRRGAWWIYILLNTMLMINPMISKISMAYTGILRYMDST